MNDHVSHSLWSFQVCNYVFRTCQCFYYVLSIDQQDFADIDKSHIRDIFRWHSDLFQNIEKALRVRAQNARAFISI